MQNYTIVFGAGAVARKVMTELKQFNIVLFVDNDINKQGDKYYGYDVFSPNAILENPDYTVVICMQYPAQAVQQLERMNVCNDIYVVDTRYLPHVNFIKLNGFDYTSDMLFDHEYTNYLEYHSPISQWKRPELYYAAAETILHIQTNNALAVLEIGCGAGQFAQLLFQGGITNYLGIDLSSKGIDLARKLNPDYADKFTVDNVFQNTKLFDDFDVIVSLEVLEHMKNDLDLVENIPAGKNFLFSVPNFWSLNHVRVFMNQDEIRERYGSLLDIKSIQEFAYGADVYYLVESVRR